MSSAATEACEDAGAYALCAPADDPLSGINAGSLSVKLAGSVQEIRKAQALRYQVFVEEIGAHPSAAMQAQKRDFDAFDAACDHLLVMEHAAPEGPRVVGTYRLLRREPMQRVGHFYTESEFDIGPIVRSGGNILELGRSCVHPDYRNRAVMQLLWRGIAAYVERYRVALMFGCGSLYGADPQQHRLALSYLWHYHLAPPEFRMRALPERYVEMNLLPKDAIDAREAFSLLPALIKGYLRLGGYIGDGAVIDSEYNTTDVGIIVRTEQVTARYAQRYAAPDVKDGLLPREKP